MIPHCIGCYLHTKENFLIYYNKICSRTKLMVLICIKQNLNVYLSTTEKTKNKSLASSMNRLLQIADSSLQKPRQNQTKNNKIFRSNPKSIQNNSNPFQIREVYRVFELDPTLDDLSAASRNNGHLHLKNPNKNQNPSHKYRLPKWVTISNRERELCE